MPDDPNNPQGPGNNNPQGPVNPDLSAALNVLSGLTTTMAALGETLEKTFTTVADMTDKVVDHLTDGVGTMKDFVKYSDNLQESYKEVANWSKKAQKIGKDQMRDTDKAKKELEKLMGIYNKILKDSKANRTETELLNKELDKVKKVYSEIGKAIKLNEEELAKVGEIVSDSTKNVLALAKALSQLRPSLAHFKGIMGMLGTVGIGKGINYKIDRRLEQIQELKDKTEETKKHRLAATREHMTNKRDAAFKEMKKMQEAGEPRQFDEKGKPTERGMQFLMKKMGFKGKKAADFKAGTMAEGFESEGATGIGYTAAMEGGSGVVGAMSTLSEGIEGAITALTGIAPEIMIPLEVLAGVIVGLSALMGTYIKQNKEMEGKLGKAGLFSGARAGELAGTAFETARNALTPRLMGQGLGLGITFERNLDLAGGLAAGGTNIGGSLVDNAPDTANQGPGGNRGYMRGSLGEAQRVVFGAARVAGLTDTEGVTELLKLLDQYGQTMRSSEKFFTQLNKDTQAAGISTTKYLKIIDEVSMHFDRMNRSLEFTTEMMRNLSRYGAISSESLKDMMEFLSQGGDKRNSGNLAQTMWQEALKNPAQIIQGNKRFQQEAGTYVDMYNDEVDSGKLVDANGQSVGADKIDKSTIQDLIAKGDTTKAVSLIEAQRVAVSNVQDERTRKNLEDALNNLTLSLRQSAAYAPGSTMEGRAASATLFQRSQYQTAATAQDNVLSALKYSGTDLSSILTGSINPDAAMALTQILDAIGVKGDAVAFIQQNSQDMATGRIKDIDEMPGGLPGAGKEDVAAQKDARKALFRELWQANKTRGPFLVDLGTKGASKELISEVENGTKSTDDLYDALDSQQTNPKKLLSELQLLVEELPSTQAMVLKNLKPMDIKDPDLAKSIEDEASIQKREISPSDVLEQLIAPLLNKLIFFVEHMANSWIFGGPTDSDRLTKAFEDAKIPETMDAARKESAEAAATLKRLNSENQTDAVKNREKLLETTIDKDTALVEYLKKYEGLGMFKNDVQMQEILDKLSGNQSNDDLDPDLNTGVWFMGHKIPQGAGGSPSGPPVSHTVYNFYSAQINQDAGYNDSASVSNEQAGKQMHPAIAPWLNGGLPNRNQ